MRLLTPDGLAYPITVTKLRCKLNDAVERDTPLFDYTYRTTNVEYDEDAREDRTIEKTYPATFRSYAEGTLESWTIREGTVISRPRIRICDIDEPCKHEVQFGGLCANCGKDMTTVTHNTVTRDTERAKVNTVHGHTALLVSQEEASRADEEAKRRLLSSRKLSLVVDLDQTIIHAAVDPTIGEWLDDPTNPNHESVKDVKKFQLIDDGPGARGCWYYIKLRPGLQEFLETMAKYYELHIYTMGTRAYAQNIAKLIDPDRKFFADRVLSRDESGSMTVKNLKRLFPVDTKMVVIIDDRGDVWHWSPNLITVTRYVFFSGIGDINSSFLPKRPELEPPPAKPAKNADGVAAEDHATTTANGNGTGSDKPAATAQSKPNADGGVSTIDQLMSMGGNSDANRLQQQTTEQDEMIAAQLTDRPLLQKQKILDDAVEREKEQELEAGTSEDKEGTAAEPPPKHRHNLLQDDDIELEHLSKSLQNVHTTFFSEYERKLAGSQGGRVAELRPGENKKAPIDTMDIPDVSNLMASMKGKVLRGVHIVFSGVVPLGIDVQSHDLAVWAKSFGATVTENITKRTSHVIASPQRRTAKVRQAAKKPDRIKIVNQLWLTDSLVQWRKLNEGPYRIHSEVAENGEKPAIGTRSSLDELNETAPLSSSEEEAALTEEESGAPNGTDLKPDEDTDTEAQAELAKYMPTLSKEDSTSHVETKEEWTEMDDELREFLGSDDETDGENESTRSSDSESAADGPPSGKKRKRGERNAEDSTTEGGESDASLSGSRLQKRKKKALARTTSLANMATTSTAGSTPVKPSEEDAGGGDGASTHGGSTDDELEAELLAAMDQEDEEDGSGAQA